MTVNTPDERPTGPVVLDLRNITLRFGGVTAMGCTVGQGITGFSTLALGSIVTFLAIVAGAAATLKFQYWRVMREA